jgi:spore maturation protein A
MKTRKNKLMLLVMNSLSIQLIPTTVLALRASSGGKIDVILPTLIATTFTTVLGVILVKVFVKE